MYKRQIDTRATNVDVERYNQKYDDLASDSSKGRSTDNIVKKQKFTNRTQRQQGRRQKREDVYKRQFQSLPCGIMLLCQMYIQQPLFRS